LKVEGTDKQDYKPRPLFCKAEMLLKHKSVNHFNLVRQNIMEARRRQAARLLSWPAYRTSTRTARLDKTPGVPGGPQATTWEPPQLLSPAHATNDGHKSRLASRYSGLGAWQAEEKPRAKPLAGAIASEDRFRFDLATGSSSYGAHQIMALTSCPRRVFGTLVALRRAAPDQA
jgi:hypothetical protein